MRSFSRRQFLQRSAAVAGTVAAPALAATRQSANSRIRLGLLGMGGRMKAHVSALTTILDRENIEIAAVCDCHQAKLDTLTQVYPELADRKLKHFANWIQAMRARDHKLLTADVEEGHRSMVMSVLPRVSYQVGRPLQFDPATERVVGDNEADRMLNSPEYRSPYVVPAHV